MVKGINTEHRNIKYQSDLNLPSHLRATNSLQEAVHDADLVVLVVPSHVMRSIVSECAQWLKPGAIIVSASKGIENETLMTMEEVLSETLQGHLEEISLFYLDQVLLGKQ